MGPASQGQDGFPTQTIFDFSRYHDRMSLKKNPKKKGHVSPSFGGPILESACLRTWRIEPEDTPGDTKGSTSLEAFGLRQSDVG